MHAQQKISAAPNDHLCHALKLAHHPQPELMVCFEGSLYTQAVQGLKLEASGQHLLRVAGDTVLLRPALHLALSRMQRCSPAAMCAGSS